MHYFIQVTYIFIAKHNFNFTWWTDFFTQFSEMITQLDPFFLQKNKNKLFVTGSDKTNTIQNNTPVKTISRFIGNYLCIIRN